MQKTKAMFTQSTPKEKILIAFIILSLVTIIPALYYQMVVNA